MYVAKFKIDKREPKKLHFNVSKRDTKYLQFKVTDREPIKFKISSNFKMNVE